MSERHIHIHLPRVVTADYGPFTKSLHPRAPGGYFVKSRASKAKKKRLSKAKQYRKKGTK